MKLQSLSALGCVLWIWSAFAAEPTKPPMTTPPVGPAPAPAPAATLTERATFGGGCFWCIEAVFERLPGVKAVVSGYAGGHLENPTYKAVCNGNTGHAEVVQIEFDPQEVTYEHLLDVFWQAHDPTTLNAQGADVGTQYRSVIFYHNEAQRVAATKSKAAAAQLLAHPIVTEIQPLKQFYAAEGYHQDYYRNNPNYPYCKVVIKPKLDKLEPKLASPR